MPSSATARKIDFEETTKPESQTMVCAACGGPIRLNETHRIERDHPVHANPADCLRHEGYNPHITAE